MFEFLVSYSFYNIFSFINVLEKIALFSNSDCIKVKDKEKKN